MQTLKFAAFALVLAGASLLQAPSFAVAQQAKFDVTPLTEAAEKGNCPVLKSILDGLASGDARLSALNEAAKLNAEHRQSDLSIPKLTVTHGQYPQSVRAYIYLDNSAKIPDAKSRTQNPTFNSEYNPEHQLYLETFEVGFPNATRIAVCPN
jgi:hypothetical protein